MESGSRTGKTMRLVTIAGEREVLGRNAAMKLILDRPETDERVGHTLTAPKLALQLSETGAHYSTEIFLVKGMAAR